MENISGIKEIHSIKEVDRYLRKDSLLLLDIDDTLITPCTKSYLIEDPNKEFRDNFSHLHERGTFKFHKDKFMSFNNPHYMWLVKRYNTRIELATWKVTESDLSKTIRNFKKKCRRVLGLTARGLETYKTTVKTLKNLGLEFERMKHNKKIIMPNVTCGRTGYSSKGILFCGGYNKDEVIEWAFINCPKDEDLLEHYSAVILVDDSKTNLIHVQKLCKKYNINYVGLHYVRQ